MNKIIFVTVMTITTLASASTSGLFCVDTLGSGKFQNVLEGDWDACSSEIYTGNVCFVGSRAEVIDILNSSAISEKFEGTDGESIKGAHYYGKKIRYYAVDQANDWSNEIVIDRCK